MEPDSVSDSSVFEPSNKSSPLITGQATTTDQLDTSQDLQHHKSNASSVMSSPPVAQNTRYLRRNKDSYLLNPPNLFVITIQQQEQLFSLSTIGNPFIQTLTCQLSLLGTPVLYTSIIQVRTSIPLPTTTYLMNLSYLMIQQTYPSCLMYHIPHHIQTEQNVPISMPRLQQLNGMDGNIGSAIIVLKNIRYQVGQKSCKII